MGWLLRRQPAKRMGPHGKGLSTGGFLKGLQVEYTLLKPVKNFLKPKVAHLSSRKYQPKASLWDL